MKIKPLEALYTANEYTAIELNSHKFSNLLVETQGNVITFLAGSYLKSNGKDIYFDTDSIVTLPSVTSQFTDYFIYLIINNDTQERSLEFRTERSEINNPEGIQEIELGLISHDVGTTYLQNSNFIPSSQNNEAKITKSGGIGLTESVYIPEFVNNNPSDLGFKEICIKVNAGGKFYWASAPIVNGQNHFALSLHYSDPGNVYIYTFILSLANGLLTFAQGEDLRLSATGNVLLIKKEISELEFRT